MIERRFDYVHVFETRRPVLEDMAQALSGVVKPDGMLWISWPKKAARVPTAITEDELRSIFLPLELVDVKVCAVDETWSGPKVRDPKGTARRSLKHGAIFRFPCRLSFLVFTHVFGPNPVPAFRRHALGFPSAIAAGARDTLSTRHRLHP